MNKTPLDAFHYAALAVFLFACAILFVVAVFCGFRGCSKQEPPKTNINETPSAKTESAKAEIQTPEKREYPDRYVPANPKDLTEADGAEEYAPEEPKTVLSANTGFVYRESYYDALTERRERIPMTEEWQRYLYEVSAKYGVPAELTLAVTGMETCFDVHIGSRFDQHGNEYYGAGMVCVDCAEEHLARLGITLCTPEGGLEAVAYILREKLDEFPNDIHKALIAYNCGSYGAQTLFDNGITETNYSKRVLQIMEGF